MTTTTKKITKATFKSFIRKNPDLYIKVKSKFDCMTDCVQPENNGFTKAEPAYNVSMEHNFGIQGVWLVGSSDDYFTHYEDDNFVGIDVYNCTGHFILATPK